MKRLGFLAAAAATLAATSSDADAQERGLRRDGAAPSARHYRDGRHDGHRGYRHGYSRYGYYGAPFYRSWRYYDPYWYGAAPAFAYPYPIYEPGPAIVERGYPPPYLGERPQPYRERSYAEAQPSKPAPKAPAAPLRERYTLSATELFEFDKAVLIMPQPKLDEIAEAMKANPQVAEVTITGYTDRLGSEAYNLELSMRRAAIVKSYLVEKGVEALRLKAVGKGEANPVAHCDDTLKRAELIKCLEPNRRVEVEPITVERRAP